MQTQKFQQNGPPMEHALSAEQYQEFLNRMPSSQPMVVNSSTQKQKCDEKSYHADTAYNQGDHGQVFADAPTAWKGEGLRLEIIQALNHLVGRAKRADEVAIARILSNAVEQLESEKI